MCCKTNTSSFDLHPPPACFSPVTTKSRLEICQVGGVKPGSPFGVMEKTSGGHPHSAQHRHRGELRWGTTPQLHPNTLARWRPLHQTYRQIERQAASMPAVMHGQPCSQQDNVTFLSFSFRLQSLSPLSPCWQLSHLFSRHLHWEERWHQLHAFSWWSGAGFSRCLPLSLLSPSQWRGTDPEAAFLLGVMA